MQTVMNIPNEMSLHVEATGEALEIETQSLENNLLNQKILILVK